MSLIFARVHQLLRTALAALGLSSKFPRFPLSLFFGGASFTFVLKSKRPHIIYPYHTAPARAIDIIPSDPRYEFCSYVSFLTTPPFSNFLPRNSVSRRTTTTRSNDIATLFPHAIPKTRTLTFFLFETTKTTTIPTTPTSPPKVTRHQQQP